MHKKVGHPLKRKMGRRGGWGDRETIENDWENGRSGDGETKQLRNEEYKTHPKRQSIQHSAS